MREIDNGGGAEFIPKSTGPLYIYADMCSGKHKAILWRESTAGGDSGLSRDYPGLTPHTTWFLEYLLE